MSKWTKHRAKWMKCRRCNLWRVRTKVVLVRGSVPCDVLLVGEAPGASEDVIGRPFVGPAGKLLDRQLREAGYDGNDWRYCIMNLVGCFPRESSGKAAEPPKESIKACAPRLDELLEISKPSGIVRIGKLSSKHFETDLPCADVIHPAAILRMDVSQQGLAHQRNVVLLRDLLDEISPF